MNKFIIALLTFASLTLQAQKKIQKEVAYANQPLEMELNFASNIEIKTWDQATIKVEATVETNDEKYTDLFDLNIKNDPSKIEIESNSKEIFKAYRKDKKDENDLAVIYTKGLDHQFNYILYLPKNVQLELSSITGNVTSEFLRGDITVEVISGDIDVKNYSGDLKLKSISGDIDLLYKDASLVAETLTGDIHTGAKLKVDRKEKLVGKEVSIASNNSNSLSLNTISGDIYLN